MLNIFIFRTNKRGLDTSAYCNQDVLQCYSDKYNVIFALIADDMDCRRSVQLYEVVKPDGVTVTEGMSIYPIYAGVPDKFDYYTPKRRHELEFANLLRRGIEVIMLFRWCLRTTLTYALIFFRILSGTFLLFQQLISCITKALSMLLTSNKMITAVTMTPLVIMMKKLLMPQMDLTMMPLVIMGMRLLMRQTENETMKALSVLTRLLVPF